MENGQKVSSWDGEAVKEIAKHVGEMVVENQLNVLQGVEDALTGFHKLVKFVPRIRKSLEKKGKNEESIRLVITGSSVAGREKAKRRNFLDGLVNLDADDSEKSMTFQTCDLMRRELSLRSSNLQIYGALEGGSTCNLQLSPTFDFTTEIKLAYHTLGTNLIRLKHGDEELGVEFRNDITRGGDDPHPSFASYRFLELSELLDEGYLEYWENPSGEVGTSLEAMHKFMEKHKKYLDLGKIYGTTPEEVGESATELFVKYQMEQLKNSQVFLKQIDSINANLLQTARNFGIEEKFQGFKDLRDQAI